MFEYQARSARNPDPAAGQSGDGIEFDLLSIASRPGAVGVGAIDRQLARGVDWTRLIGLALWHQLTPDLARALATCASEAVPQDIGAALQYYCARQIETARRQKAETFRLIDLLDSEGIAALPFKGSVLAAQIRADALSRVSRDIDFLVRSEHAERVLHLLMRQGYRYDRLPTPRQRQASQRYYGQECLGNPESGLCVEPHWSIAPFTFAIDLDTDGLFERAVRTPLADRSVWTMSPEDSLLTLCIHGSKELWVRLKWVRDIVDWVEHGPAVDWRRLYTLACSTRTERMLNIGLVLAHRIYALPLPPVCLNHLEQDRAALRLARRMHGLLRSTDCARLRELDYLRLRRGLHRRLRDQSRFLWRTAVHPKNRHYKLCQLPDRLFGLYYPIKIVHDYLLLPVWRVGKRLHHGFVPHGPRTGVTQPP